MEKIVIIINGNGGVGKDTLCDFAGAIYRVISVSAVSPIKKIAWQYGWRGEKDPKSRKFLADLKRTFVDYNDLPNRYLVEEYEKFLSNDAQVLFVHIREGEEIDKFKSYVTIPCITLLIRRKNVQEYWGNESDDNVENYKYDYYYNNDKPLSEARRDFLNFFRRIIGDNLKKRINLSDESCNNLFSQNRLANTIPNRHLQDKKLLQESL